MHAVVKTKIASCPVMVKARLVTELMMCLRQSISVQNMLPSPAPLIATMTKIAAIKKL